jgi:hypothetical protein
MHQKLVFGAFYCKASLYDIETLSIYNIRILRPNQGDRVMGALVEM